MHRNEAEPDEQNLRYMEAEEAFSRQQIPIVEKRRAALFCSSAEHSTAQEPSNHPAKLHSTEATCGISAEMLVRGLAPWTLLWLSVAGEASVNSMGRKQRQLTNAHCDVVT